MSWKLAGFNVLRIIDILNYNDIDNENLKNNIDKFGKIF